MPRALAQQPLSYIPTARPLDHVGVTHDDQPIGRRDSPTQRAPGSARDFRLRSDTARRHCRSSSPRGTSTPADGQPHRLPQRDRVQAMVDVAVTYLETLPGEPADDHTVVMVHVNAEALDVPAGTSVESGSCHVEATAPSSLQQPNGCCVRRRCRAYWSGAEERCSALVVRGVSRPVRSVAR